MSYNKRARRPALRAALPGVLKDSGTVVRDHSRPVR